MPTGTIIIHYIACRNVYSASFYNSFTAGVLQHASGTTIHGHGVPAFMQPPGFCLLARREIYLVTGRTTSSGYAPAASFPQHPPKQQHEMHMKMAERANRSHAKRKLPTACPIFSAPSVQPAQYFQEVQYRETTGEER
jgi:hypothetical protein